VNRWALLSQFQILISIWLSFLLWWRFYHRKQLDASLRSLQGRYEKKGGTPEGESVEDQLGAGLRTLGRENQRMYWKRVCKTLQVKKKETSFSLWEKELFIPKICRRWSIVGGESMIRRTLSWNLACRPGEKLYVMTVHNNKWLDKVMSHHVAGIRPYLI